MAWQAKSKVITGQLWLAGPVLSSKPEQSHLTKTLRLYIWGMAALCVRLGIHLSV